MAEQQSATSTPPAPAAPAAPTKAPAKPRPKRKRRTKKLPPYHVVLLDDDDHTYEYVIEMLRAIFGYGIEKGLKLAEEVDSSGRVIVFTPHKELAELKRDQILAFGTDARIASCKGSMTAVIEPAEG